MSSSVCYFYFRPVIDKRQPICYAVMLLWFILVDSTAVTKDNLLWKKEHKNNEYVNLEWTLIFNEFLKCTLSYM